MYIYIIGPEFSVLVVVLFLIVRIFQSGKRLKMQSNDW